MKNRNVIINKIPSCMRLENAFWHALHDIARREGITMTSFLSAIEPGDNRASATRVAILQYYRARTPK